MIRGEARLRSTYIYVRGQKMTQGILIACFMAVLSLCACEMPKSSAPTPVKSVEPLETAPKKKCSVNAECWCRNFSGAEFLVGKVESRCKNKQCVTCLYD